MTHFEVKYKSFEKNSLREELIMCMSNVRCLFRDHATNIVQMALNLHLPITSGLGDKVAHKVALVPILLRSLDFLHKVELICFTSVHVLQALFNS